MEASERDRLAADLVRLVRAHDATGVGVEPVPRHVERAREAVARALRPDGRVLVQTTFATDRLAAATPLPPRTRDQIRRVPA